MNNTHLTNIMGVKLVCTGRVGSSYSISGILVVLLLIDTNTNTIWRLNNQRNHVDNEVALRWVYELTIYYDCHKEKEC